MSNKSYFFNNKLSYNLKSYKSYKFIIFLLLLILVAIIFVDYNSFFNTFEGYCKYNSANLANDSKDQAKRIESDYENKTDDLNETELLLRRADHIPAGII